MPVFAWGALNKHFGVKLLFDIKMLSEFVIIISLKASAMVYS